MPPVALAARAAPDAAAAPAQELQAPFSASYDLHATEGHRAPAASTLAAAPRLDAEPLVLRIAQRSRAASSASSCPATSRSRASFASSMSAVLPGALPQRGRHALGQAPRGRHLRLAGAPRNGRVRGKPGRPAAQARRARRYVDPDRTDGRPAARQRAFGLSPDRQEPGQGLPVHAASAPRRCRPRSATRQGRRLPQPPIGSRSSTLFWCAPELGYLPREGRAARRRRPDRVDDERAVRCPSNRSGRRRGAPSGLGSVTPRWPWYLPPRSR